MRIRIQLKNLCKNLKITNTVPYEEHSLVKKTTKEKAQKPLYFNKKNYIYYQFPCVFLLFLFNADPESQPCLNLITLLWQRDRGIEPEALHAREEPLSQLLLMMGQMIIAAPLSMRIEWPRLIRQPARRLSPRSRSNPAPDSRCGRLAAVGRGCGGCGGGVWCVMVNGGYGVRRGGGGWAGALGIATAAQALDEAELHGLGRGLGRLLAHLQQGQVKL